MERKAREGDTAAPKGTGYGRNRERNNVELNRKGTMEES
jgi:hypothetical protein